ncbi:hypothetical protein EDB87DRAFT_1641369 [Lactarius vividus]|nr:hypothetical protein EDB87DRAFT_1641369 [Lactarius vividus]
MNERSEYGLWAPYEGVFDCIVISLSSVSLWALGCIFLCSALCDQYKSVFGVAPAWAIITFLSYSISFAIWNLHAILLRAN